VAVHGIDLSRAMVARLRAKPGGEAIGVTIGDFATARADGTFTVAYLVFNTIMSLTTQAAQVACFRNVAAHLEPGGCFVIEVLMPDLQRLLPGQTVAPFHVSPTPHAFDIYDTATQAMSSNCVHLTDGHGEYRPVPFRYVWPAELEPDGPARRVATARAVGRVDTGTIHEREPPACLNLGEARRLAARLGTLATYRPHASNAANAACGSCFNLNTVCFDKRSAFAMADRLGGLAPSRASLMRSNVARS